MLTQTSIRDVASIAEEAYVLAYPLVQMSRELEQAPVNTLVHARDTPDTMRLSGWLDLAAEPLLLSVAATHGRFYALWLRDAWDTLFATVGARTTGTAEQSHALVGPGSRGARPRSGSTLIEAPTRSVRLTGCVETVGDTDEEARRRVNEDFRVTAGEAPLRARSASEHTTARAFFADVARLAVEDPPAGAARAALERLRQLGPWWSLEPELRASVEAGVARARHTIQLAANRPPREPSGEWRVDLHPDARDDPAADALSAWLDGDADGRPLTGSSCYLLRFAHDGLPPVHGFWSLTTAPATAHSIGDRRGLTLDADGALPIQIQREPPARRGRANWLPAPPGTFSLTLRLYWPAADALGGRWAPPPVVQQR